MELRAGSETGLRELVAVSPRQENERRSRFCRSCRQRRAKRMGRVRFSIQGCSFLGTWVLSLLSFAAADRADRAAKVMAEKKRAIMGISLLDLQIPFLDRKM